MQLSRCPLSLRPRSGEQVPPLTAQVARASNPGGTTAIWVRDRLDGLWSDEDFTDWYPRDGRPGLSPAQLATVCVLQFLLGLSDRQAAEAVRCRIDFKYAMALELDDPGFHHSVLADFRDRLAEGDRADRLLDLALARLKEAGLVRERTTQRTDSTHVLAAVRDLTRLELITEAVRAALEEVAGISPHLLDELVDEDWGLRYGRPVRLSKNPTKPKTRILATGNDAVRLLEAHPVAQVLLGQVPHGVLALGDVMHRGVRGRRAGLAAGGGSAWGLGAVAGVRCVWRGGGRGRGGGHGGGRCGDQQYTADQETGETLWCGEAGQVWCGGRGPRRSRSGRGRPTTAIPPRRRWSAR
jgi:transposase